MKRDLRFAKLTVAINCAVPATLLFYDAVRGQLGTNGVNYALRTTGMLALVFLMLSLAITPLRRLFGWSSLIVYRRTLGLYAFFHAALHFWIFFVFDRDLSIRSAVHEILTRTYLQIGTIALVLLIPLAFTSTDRALERLGAKRWKLLHRLTYVISAGGVLHYYLLVKADHRKPIIFACVLGVLLGWRVALWLLDRRKKKPVAAAQAPRPRSRRYRGELVVARIFEETPDVRTFRLTAEGGGALPFDYDPGQYLNLSLDTDTGRVGRSYTIASSPTRNAYCEITVKREDAGLGSRHLHDRITEGSRLAVIAPAGKFVFTGGDEASVVLVAGGVGITPIMSIARYLTDKSWKGRIHLVYSARSERDIVFVEELALLQRRFPNLHVTLTLTRETGEGWSGKRGRVGAVLREAVGPDLLESPVYLCGPTTMIEETTALLVGFGVPADRIFSEVFLSPVTPPGASERPTASATEAVEDSAEIDDSGEAPVVRFEASDKTVETTSDKTVLEAAEDAGVAIPFECRAGICGQCKVHLLSGQVTMDAEDALTRQDRARDLILACQARPRGDITVEA